MSSGHTREALLDAGVELLAGGGPAALTMAAVAGAAGVSRQAVYLHFGSRNGLLLALVAHLDAREGLADLVREIEAAPTATDALVASLRVTARYAPRIHPIAAAFDRARREDPAVAAAWEDRMATRRAGLLAITRLLSAEGSLAPGWTPEHAADALVALGAPATWDALVVDRGWTPVEYEAFLVAVGIGGFCRSPAPPTR